MKQTWANVNYSCTVNKWSMTNSCCCPENDTAVSSFSFCAFFGHNATVSNSVSSLNKLDDQMGKAPRKHSVELGWGNGCGCACTCQSVSRPAAGSAGLMSPAATALCHFAQVGRGEATGAEGHIRVRVRLTLIALCDKLRGQFSRDNYSSHRQCQQTWHKDNGTSNERFKQWSVYIALPSLWATTHLEHFYAHRTQNIQSKKKQKNNTLLIWHECTMRSLSGPLKSGKAFVLKFKFQALLHCIKWQHKLH